MSDQPRDQLVALLIERQHCCRSRGRAVADAVTILAAGWQPPPRLIGTAEELDALQPAAGIIRAWDEDRNMVVPALIRGADNFTFERVTDVECLRVERGRTAWYQPGSVIPRRSDELAYPVTVLVEPEVHDA